MNDLDIFGTDDYELIQEMYEEMTWDKRSDEYYTNEQEVDE